MSVETHVARSARRHLRLAWVLVACVALGLRLHYIFAFPQTSVHSDAAMYDRAGQAVARWLGPDLPKLIGGILQWQLDVLRHFAGDLSSRIMAKGPTYPLFLGCIYLIFGHHYLAVRVAQAILGACTAVLVGAIGRKLDNETAGLVAAGVYAIYPPVILMAGRLLQETLALLLLALLLWLLLQGIDEDRPTNRGPLLAAGIVLGAVQLARPALQYLFVPLLPAYSLARIKKLGTRLGESLAIVGAFLILTVPAVALLTALTGRVSINGALALQAEPGFFHGLHPSSRGWRPDLTDPTGEGGPPGFLGERDVPRGQTYHQATMSLLRKNPFAPLTMGVQKAFWYYTLPPTDWHENYLLSRPGVVTLHKTVVLFGLFGLTTSLGRWRRILPVLTLATYVIGICALVDIEARYGMPALVAWVPLAGAGLSHLGRVSNQWSRGWVAQGWVLGLFCGIAFLASPILEVPVLLAALPLGNPVIAFWCSEALRALVLILTLVSLDRLFIMQPANLPRRWGMTVAAIFVSIVALHHDRSGEGNWHEWKARLSSPDLRIEQILRMPRALGEAKRAFLFVDIDPQLSKGEEVRVQFGDGTSVRVTAENLAGECFRRYRQEAAERWQGAYGIDEHQWNLGSLTLRKWLEVPVPTLPQAGEVMHVTLDLPRGGTVDVYGDFASRPDLAQFEGPSLDVCAATLLTSFYKSLDTRDYRIWQTIRLTGEAESRRWEGSRVRKDDLSSDLGVQSGRYRIFMVIEGMNGTRLVV